MNKSILVLDENSVIHGQVTSALESEGLTLHHEFNPGRYVERATSLMPDLILVGNSAQDPEYDVCRRLKDTGSLDEVPLVLMAGSKDAISRERLEALRVAGVVRKPFEASDLQQQISKHLNLVDLIGSAYEFRQSQRTTEDGGNPLANLDVVDDEVLGLLRGEAPSDEPPDLQGNLGGDTPSVIDDEVLAEALQPERAFEMLDEEAPAPPPPPVEPLETLDGDFPTESRDVPSDETELDELGAADVLDEDSAEEMVFEPQGFDQDLDADTEPAVADDTTSTLDDIEVELPEESLDASELEPDTDEGGVDLFETDLTGDGDGDELEEAIPLSVRRMMELKPVFTMTQEESAEEEVLEPFDFAPDEDDVVALQAGLDDLDDVDLEGDALEAVEEQELQFASEQELESMEVELGAGTELAPEPAVDEDLEPPDAFDLMGDDAAEPHAAPVDLEPAPEAAPFEPEPELEAAPEEPDTFEAASNLDDLDLEADAPDDEELEAAEIDAELVEELASPGHAQAAAQQQPPEPEPQPEPEPMTDTVAEPAEEDDDELFAEEYLGEDEIDEEQIIAADLDDEGEDQPDLSAEDEAELQELLAEDEHLAEIDELDEETLIAEEEALEDEDIAIEAEEESQILGRLESERLADEADDDLEGADAAEETMTAEPLFERNFNALDEEAGATGSGAGGTDGEETWRLDQDEGGFSIAGTEGEAGSDGDESAEAAEDVISLGAPLEDEGEDIEEMPASALEEVTEDEPVLEAEAATEETGLEAAAGDGEEEPPVSIEFGEGEGDVFDAAEDEDDWRPKAPPGFIAKPAEDFPVDAVRDPFVGPHGEPEAPEPPPTPRHRPDEVLEVPDADDVDGELAEAQAEATDDLLEAGAEDLADQVAATELDALDDEPALHEDEDSEPTLTVLADDTLQTVTGGTQAPEAEPEPPEALDDFDAVSLDDADLDGEVDLTDGEREALFGGDSDLAADAGFAEGGDEDLESMLGAGEAAAEASAGGADDPEFDNLFASLREEIAANPEGERLDEVLRKERIRDRIAELDFSLPQHETTFSRALGIYEVPGDGVGPTAYPDALQGSGPASIGAPATPAAEAAESSAFSPSLTVPAEEPAMRQMTQVSALSLLDEDIRDKLGQVLDEIISISVRKAVQEEMPKLMERMSKDR